MCFLLWFGNGYFGVVGEKFNLLRNYARGELKFLHTKKKKTRNSSKEMKTESKVLFGRDEGERKEKNEIHLNSSYIYRKRKIEHEKYKYSTF